MDITDVLVLGGGPCGSAASSMAAKAGFSVTLLEREKFPRHHIGESLLPASIPLLEALGAADEISKAGFLPKFGATMVWGIDKSPWTWRFDETNSENISSYQVSRAEFDNILLNNSRTLGVDVREESQVTDIDLEHDLVTKVNFLDKTGKKQSIKATFIIDASGQSALLSRRLGNRKWDPNFQNLAAYNYFSGGEKLSSPNENNIFIESYQNGWMWNIPLKDNITSVGTVVDANSWKGHVKDSDSFLSSQIDSTHYSKEMLSHARPMGNTRIVKDWSYRANNMTGTNWVMAGDAACFIDPLFSSGVHLALMSGVLASAVAVTTLRNPVMAKPAASEYERIFLEEYSHFRELARLFYSSNRTTDSYFWHARRILGNKDKYDPRSTFIRAVAGQSHLGYERMVLERGQLPKSFHQGMKDYQNELTDRESKLTSLGSYITQTIPCLAPGTSVRRGTVLGDGEFITGTLLYSESRPDGVPCSTLVDNLIRFINGRHTIKEIAYKISTNYDVTVRGEVVNNVLRAIHILYNDGIIAELK